MAAKEKEILNVIPYCFFYASLVITFVFALWFLLGFDNNPPKNSIRKKINDFIFNTSSLFFTILGGIGFLLLVLYYLNGLKIFGKMICKLFG